MAPVTNGRLLFNESPSGYPEPGKTTVYDVSQTIDLDNVPLNGGTLLKTLYLSIDPYLRFRMRDPKEEKDIPLFTVGEPITSHGVAVVLRSEYPAYKPGDHVYGILPHAQYIVWRKELSDSPFASPPTIIENKAKIPWSLFVGVAGMPGLTAYAGWKRFAKFNKGDTVFVTTAAGPVGATVVQLAKADGLRVIASAGSKEKIDFVKSLGADVVFNYKEEKTRDVLQREGPVNIYWDHVGGDTTDAVIENTAIGATIIVCGSIAGYNGTPNPVHQHALIFERDLTIYGFRLFTIMGPYVEAFYEEIPKMIASGQLKYRELVIEGLENGGQALLDVLLGKNEGKSVIKVSDD